MAGMNVPEKGVLLLAVAAVVVLLVVLEAWRQTRIYGKASGRPNLAGAGMLELQKHLQADRRVEKLVEWQRDESPETERDEAGGRRRPPESPAT
jgi:hypothetical protein